MVKHRIRGNRTVVISGRLSPAMAARFEWLIRNIDVVDDRAEGVKDAVETWIKVREKEAVAHGLFPPSF